MKKCPLTAVGAFFVILFAVIMAVYKKQKQSEANTTTSTEIREVQTKRPRTKKPIQEGNKVITVIYSTKAYLKEGE